MNGAAALLGTLSANGVTTCFANPGTTEMHLVAAFEDSGVHPVLCLFEGVATGAADGYARVTGEPAATLLHLGPGLGNGWANLHNAARAHSPVLNLVGDHATRHLGLHSMLESDLRGLAGSLGGWFDRVDAAAQAPALAMAAVAATLQWPHSIATLALAADAMWTEAGAGPWPVFSAPACPEPDEHALHDACDALGPRSALVLGGRLSAGALRAAWRVSRATGSRVLLETMPAFVARGAGVPAPERIIYVPEFALAQLSELEHVVLVGAPEPVAAFAYPNVPSRLLPEGCTRHSLTRPGVDAEPALRALADCLGANERFGADSLELTSPSGALTAETLALAVAATLPEDAIIVDESNTSGIHLERALASAARHHWTGLSGAAIGYGLPTAVGAGVASGGRVLALESDGSMLYTAQALWTMAREGLDVTVVALANGRYAVLDMERRRLGAPDAESERLFDLGRPAMDLAGLARSLGVRASVATTAEELVAALSASYATPGPSFIEARLPSAI